MGQKMAGQEFFLNFNQVCASGTSNKPAEEPWQSESENLERSTFKNLLVTAGV